MNCDENDLITAVVADLLPEPGMPETPEAAVDVFFEDLGVSDPQLEDFRKNDSAPEDFDSDGKKNIEFVHDIAGKRGAVVIVEEVGIGWAVEKAAICSKSAKMWREQSR